MTGTKVIYIVDIEKEIEKQRRGRAYGRRCLEPDPGVFSRRKY